MPDVKLQFPLSKPALKVQRPNLIKTSKYTWLNFLPKNLYEQLHKFGNNYFLVISLIMYLGEKTPLYVGTIKAFSTIGVLVMMMAVSATMSLLDDLRRKEADREINLHTAYAWPWRGQKTLKKWEDVTVGDILVVKQDEEFPADMVPFYCSGEGGNCYVSTANLDGETNLKLKSASKDMQKACTPRDNADYSPERKGHGVPRLEKEVLEMIAEVRGHVVAEEPNNNIHDFKGSLSLEAPQKTDESLGAAQLLLRGTKLRNTDLVVGIVVYCGGDTRMIKNSRPAPAKLSTLELFTNNSMKLILIAQGLLALFSSFCFRYNKWYFANLWYLHLRNDLWLPDIPAYWLTFFTLYSNLMPISLYPTTEFCNAMQSFFIRNDKHMVYQENDLDNGVPFPARARSSNLCQELGQIKYLFSDKTGTLTQNVMNLKRLSIGQSKYGSLVSKVDSFDGKETLDHDRNEGTTNSEQIESFLEVLAVAHTVMASKGEDGKLSYEAESPDEDALVHAARDLGWIFESRKGNTLTCTQESRAGPQMEHSYTVLATNQFTSARKRMSIIVQKDEEKYLLFMKGADNVMFERAEKKGGHMYQDLKRDLSEFSREGLRTLVIGQKKLDNSVVEEWLKEYEAANKLTDGREKALEEAAERLEKDIEVLGATAIEDKLQDKVPETIEKIRTAGIKLWVLTGDKLETAKNIGFSTKVLDPKMTMAQLDNGEEGGEGLEEVIKNLENAPHGRAMMVTGKALAGLLSNEKLKYKFLTAAEKCEVLMACRVSPMQKAELVKLIRESAPKGQEPITAAIGDGANDVPMIQEAQVGIGIAGREGRQSVNNSDFAIGQFKYLQRLLFVHGRWNYLRACKFTLFTFWRNMVQVLIMFSYTFFSGFSGTVLFEDWLRLTFNGFGTIPVLAVGAFDQDVPAKVAYCNPRLYAVGREGQELNIKKTLQTFIAAVFHAAVIVIVTWAAYPGMDVWGAGDYYTFGSAVYTCLLIEMTYRVAFLTCSHNKYTIGVIVFTLCGYVFFLVAYPCVQFVANIFQPNMYMVPVYMVSNASFWICIVAVPMIGWSVDIFTSWTKHKCFPDDVDVLRPEDLQDHRSSEDHGVLEDDSTRSLLDTESTVGSLGFEPPHVPQYLTDRQGKPVVNLTDYAQQALRSYRIRTSYGLAMRITLVCGLVLFALGFCVFYISSSAAQVRVIYQNAKRGETKLESEIPWGTLDNEVFHPHHCTPKPGLNINQNFTCNVTIPSDMEPPLLVYYGVAPFYQNLVTYIKSEVSKELMGKEVDQVTREAKCLNKMFRTKGEEQIVPCGAKASTLFNDTLQLAHQDGNPIKIKKTGIAWASDVRRYDNPADYKQRQNTMWLYELFPTVISKEDGVKSEAFAAWMRPEALGRVQNNYGWVEERLQKGAQVSFSINSIFNATAESSKFFVITQRLAFGGRDPVLGIVLMIVGVCCLVLALIVICHGEDDNRRQYCMD